MPEKNMLAGETSPYLQQHRNNPVHWQPWGRAALDSARKRDKPILLSVGYSACHWCHVMAHECFEDEEVATVMNELFVSIKVDREERPDIDQIYMAALNATGEQGGWPLTMFLTPEGKPFWGGTYFPKQPRYGRPGFIQVMNSVHQAWTERRAAIDTGAAELTDHVESRLAAKRPAAQPSAAPVLQLAPRIAQLIDSERGGISGAPKFPNAPFMTTLWLAGLETGDSAFFDHVTDSLEKMLAGGIYDHIGGGLCRYSTDADWLIPHFEKMLYDNAQLIQLATLAHAHTGKEMFRHRINETVDWLEREMTVASGAFASSLDADSEGEEGKYYLWTKSAIEEALGSEAESFFEIYDLRAPTGWEGDPVIARKRGTTAAPQEQLETLLEARQTRIRPHRDDKVLTDWNAMTISALALAARHFHDDRWQRIAARAYESIATTADETGRLPHSVNGESRLYPAMSQDYAAMITAAIAMFELTSDGRYIEQARTWLLRLDEDHGDGGDGHYLTSVHASDVPIRIRGDIDEAVPSATSQIIEALAKLASATGDIAVQERASHAAAAALGRALTQNHGQAGIFNAVLLAANPAKLVLVEDPSNTVLSAVADRIPDPRRVDVKIPVGARPDADILPGAITFDTSSPGAWLCRGMTCLPPIRAVDELEQALRGFPAQT